jgi:hypothetical protein
MHDFDGSGQSDGDLPLSDHAGFMPCMGRLKQVNALPLRS